MKISYSDLCGNKRLCSNIALNAFLVAGTTAMSSRANRKCAHCMAVVSARSGEVPMNSPILAVLVNIIIMIGSTLTLMNKACKNGYHSWCAPMSVLVRHHTKARAPA